MGAPREWPTKAADDRDSVAVFVKNGADALEEISGQLPPETRVKVMKVQLDLQKSLTILTKHGARVRMPEPLQTFR
jgi:hypothetical protein